MGKRIIRRGRFFTPPGPHDPIGNICAEVCNRMADLAIEKLSQEAAKKLGMTCNMADEQARQRRLQLALAKDEAAFTTSKALSERQISFLDLKIRERAIVVERAQRQLDNAQAINPQIGLQGESAVVSGALEVAADPQGLAGTPEQSEGYARWLGGFPEGKIALITGRRGSGKTALIAKMAEYMAATYKMPTYWLGLPDEARRLVPKWITLVDDAHKCPVNSFIVCDEAGINFLSLLFQDKRNMFMRRLMMVCRQRHCSLAFAVQNTRDVDLSIVRQADSLIFKQPGMHQPETERVDIRPLARKAALAFQGMTPEESSKSSSKT